MSYKPARGYVPLKSYAQTAPFKLYPHQKRLLDALTCSATRQGDEMACRCGKRWPIGEDHP